MKTRDEVEHLKQNWYNDPIWDLPETEGFDEYRDELREYRDQCNVIHAAAAEYRTTRSTKYNVDRAMEQIDYYMNAPIAGSLDNILALAQVHATLALVAELKRLNDQKEG